MNGITKWSIHVVEEIDYLIGMLMNVAEIYCANWFTENIYHKIKGKQFQQSNLNTTFIFCANQIFLPVG